VHVCPDDVNATFLHMAGVQSNCTVKGVTAKMSPNEFFTSKMMLDPIVMNVCVSYVKANIPGEK
jgi:hypothetical protein